MAEEIVEDCMIHIWEHRQDMEHVHNFKSYLYTMVKNRAYSYLRKNKKEIPLHTISHDSIAAEVQYVIEEESHAIIIQALEALPPKCKKVFKLSCLDGVKYKDIAEEMNISVNTVKSQRTRAVELIKRQLKDYPKALIYLAFLLKNQIL